MRVAPPRGRESSSRRVSASSTPARRCVMPRTCRPFHCQFSCSCGCGSAGGLRRPVDEPGCCGCRPWCCRMALWPPAARPTSPSAEAHRAAASDAAGGCVSACSGQGSARRHHPRLLTFEARQGASARRRRRRRRRGAVPLSARAAARRACSSACCASKPTTRLEWESNLPGCTCTTKAHRDTSASAASCGRARLCGPEAGGRPWGSHGAGQPGGVVWPGRAVWLRRPAF